MAVTSVFYTNYRELSNNGELSELAKDGLT